MSKPDLQLVKPEAASNGETAGQRVRRLQREAQAAASEHVTTLIAQMAETQATAAEIADGGGVYHVGAREMAGRIAAGLAGQLLTLRQITERNT